MRVIEITALCIVAVFVVVRARFGPEPRRFLTRLALLVIASWVAEDTCIRLYGFYFYDPGWSLFVDRVPLAIVLIWPIVIHSAWELGRSLVTENRALIPLAGAGLVLADASMIEPIAVNSGLWTWTEPGVFDVPPIGIIGWAYFAGVCMLVLERVEDKGAPAWTSALAIVVAPIGAHLLLLASWWGLFRWINRPLDAWPFVIAAWLIAIGLTLKSLHRRARHRVPTRDMLNRVPAAAFFFVLLALDARDAPALIAYGLAFCPPYLSLTRLPATRRQPGEEPRRVLN